MRKVLGLALAVSVMGATSVFASPTVTMSLTYVGSTTQAEYDAAIGSFNGGPVDYLTVVDPQDPANAGMIHEYAMRFTVSGLQTNEHWYALSWNVPVVPGVTFMGTADDGAGGALLYSPSTSALGTGISWNGSGAQNGDGGTDGNDLQALVASVTKANANKNLGVSTQWGGPNVALGLMAFKWDGTTTTTLSMTSGAGNWLSTYTGQTSTTTGTSVSYTTTTATFTATPLTLTAPTSQGNPHMTFSATADAGVPAVPAALYANQLSTAISPVTGDAQSKGSFSFNLADTTDPVYVMLWLTGPLTDPMFNTANVIDPSTYTGSDPMIAYAYSVYGGSASGPTRIVKFDNLGAGVNTDAFSWEMPAGTTLTQIAAIPEPASLGLIVLGAFGLLSRRRKA